MAYLFKKEDFFRTDRQTNGRTNGLTDGRTDGQSDYIMPQILFGGIKMNFSKSLVK